ncbi:MAG: ABC transporter ATP-binding protein [Pyrinomonadaceae bacterium]
MAAKPAVTALSDVSLEISEGEVFGLIGRNGAGKTTLTKIIATLVQPTGGTVKVFGKDSVADEVFVRGKLGLATAEERSFYWRLTTTQNLMFFARLNGLSDKRAKERIAELFDQFRLNDLAKRRFSDLSTGNKQKLAVARALLTKPPLLLLDEPTRSLDPLAASDMRSMISALDNVTILLTSHNLSEIEELCDRVAVISKGSIRDVGTVKDLRGRHSETERVSIEIRSDHPFDESAIEAITGASLTRYAEKTMVVFERRTDDDALDHIIRAIGKSGATILDIETERASLLDVMEKYE